MTQLLFYSVLVIGCFAALGVIHLVFRDEGGGAPERVKACSDCAPVLLGKGAVYTADSPIAMKADPNTPPPGVIRLGEICDVHPYAFDAQAQHDLVVDAREARALRRSRRGLVARAREYLAFRRTRKAMRNVRAGVY